VADKEIPEIARYAWRELDGEPRVNVRPSEIRSLAFESAVAGTVG
jgi:hypothetical protein